MTVSGSGNTIGATGLATRAERREHDDRRGGVDVRVDLGRTAAGTAGVGISLDTTGSSGGLTVTGNGTAGSGGTIRNKTGANGSTSGGIGVYLNNTAQVSLTRMQLNDHNNFAIRANAVNGSR